jgi:hypothetical protein
VCCYPCCWHVNGRTHAPGESTARAATSTTAYAKQYLLPPLLLLLPPPLLLRYVTGRTRAPNEINGKSGNLNNCLRNVIYADHEGEPEGIPAQELIVVFDADMAAKRHFFMKVLEVMWDEETALCLTPQVRSFQHTMLCLQIPFVSAY